MITAASALMAASTAIVVVLVLLLVVASLVAVPVRLLMTPLTVATIFVIALLVLALRLILSLLTIVLMVLLVRRLIPGIVISRRRLKSSRRGRVTARMDLLEVNGCRRALPLLFLFFLGVVHHSSPVDCLASGLWCCSRVRLAIVTWSSGRLGSGLARLINRLALVLLLVWF